MVRHQDINTRIPWEDRFTQPSAENLRESLPYKTARLFDVCCRELADIAGYEEKVEWRGECWKWTLAFQLNRRKRLPRAVVIPNPDDLQIAMRMEPEFLQALDARRLRRGVRDGLDLAADTFDTDWSVWAVNSRPMVDDVLLIIRKHVEYMKTSVKN